MNEESFLCMQATSFTQIPQACPTDVMVRAEGVVVGVTMVLVLGVVEGGPFRASFPASVLALNQVEKQVVAKMEPQIAHRGEEVEFLYLENHQAHQCLTGEASQSLLMEEGVGVVEESLV